jgi:hypothetical protein
MAKAEARKSNGGEDVTGKEEAGEDEEEGC